MDTDQSVRGAQQAAPTETIKPPWSVQMLRSATGMSANCVPGSLLKSSSSYHLLLTDQPPPVGMGSSQAPKRLYSKKPSEVKRRHTYVLLLTGSHRSI